MMHVTSVKKIIIVIFICILPFLLSANKYLDESLMKSVKNNASIVILNYHKVDDMPISLSVSPEQFDQQMAYLQSEGYETITMDQLVANFEQGEKLPPKPLMITFDDGYADNYTNAYPILKKYGFQATIFVITDFLDRYPNYITWNQAKEMQNNGIKIASHTLQHKSLIELDDATIRNELSGSAAAINYHLGKQTQYFAYPTGTYNLHIADIVRECGYQAAFTIKYGNVNKASNIYALERVPVFRTDNTFRSFCERLRYLPIFERIGWVKS